MGGCQNHGPFSGTLNIRCRILIGTQKGTIILTTTHIAVVQVISWGGGLCTLGPRTQKAKAPDASTQGFCRSEVPEKAQQKS